MKGTLSDNIVGVDTVGIRDASEAFLGGGVPVPGGAALQQDAGFAASWAADDINGVLVMVAVVAGLICIPRFLGLFKYIFGCLLSWKNTSRLTSRVRLERDRNILFFLSLLPLALLSSRYGLYRTGFMAGKEPSALSLITLGVLVLFVLFREFLVNYFTPRTLADLWKVSRTNFRNAIIVITATGLLTAGIASVSGLVEGTIRTLLFYEFAIIFLVFLYRNYEILSWKGQRFKAFLYLCALELIPLILLVISGILF